MSSTLLDKLGIRSTVQAFFAPYHKELKFQYGSDFEHYGASYHRIPVTENVWIAGLPELASDIFICGSAMDAIAFNQVNDYFAFLSVGAVPTKQQLEHLPDRRFHLLFPNDTLGAVCDIKVACHLRQQPVEIIWDKTIAIKFRNQLYHLERLSLHKLEKVSGYRFGIRTHKPKNALSWTSSFDHRRSSLLSKPAPT